MNKQFISRNELIKSNINDFISSSKPYLAVELYYGEIGKIEQEYTDLCIEVCGKVHNSLKSSPRYFCVISQKQ